MEKLELGKEENIDNIRKEAISSSINLVNKQKQYLEEITQIVNSNDGIKKALYKYGPIDESLADFRVIPWGYGNLDTHSLDIEKIINANTNHKPMLDVLSDIEKELTARTNYIKETLSGFSGTENEAFDLIQKIHKEKNLKPLNSDNNPILEKLA